MKRGEIWWARIGSGRRPALILTRDHALPLLSGVTVAPTTRRIRSIPTEVALGRTDGMPHECALSLDNLETISKRDLHRRITTLSPARIEEVCDALRYAVGC